LINVNPFASLIQIVKASNTETAAVKFGLVAPALAHQLQAQDQCAFARVASMQLWKTMLFKSFLAQTECVLAPMVPTQTQTMFMRFGAQAVFLQRKSVGCYAFQLLDALVLILVSEAAEFGQVIFRAQHLRLVPRVWFMMPLKQSMEDTIGLAEVLTLPRLVLLTTSSMSRLFQI